MAASHTTLGSMVTCISRFDNVLNECLVYCLVVIFYFYGEEVEDILPNQNEI